MLSFGLPLLLAGLLFISGGVKLRAGKRAHLGSHLPSLLELLLGALLGFAAMSGAITPRAGLWTAVAGGSLVVGSSLHLGRLLSTQRALRQRTESHRLEAFVRYRSQHDPGEA